MNALVRTIDILTATDAQLVQLSKDNCLSLDLHEMRTVKKYFQSCRRNPTDIEIETIAQTWSEHCKHKTLRGVIGYTYIDGKTKKRVTKRIDNLLKHTIMKVTKDLNKPWCLSVFSDNAGVIEFDKQHGIAFKVETHNHPSAIEPYGGAGTGIGGVIRDILGVGLGAKPIFNTDVFCFGMPDTEWDALPKGVLHPKRVMKGVVAGVRDYGNRMGIPTINGAILFDKGFVCNPLVYCGTAGIIPKKYINKTVKPGDYIVAVGGRTGRDGIHGATFSSLTLDENVEASAVQIGNPIVEKKVMDTLLVARDKGLYRALTDCGAGGFSSAIGELGEFTGAEVYLERAPLKYEGLKPWEIWLSEAQERMVLAVPPRHLEALQNVFASEDVEATVLGKFTNTKNLVLLYHGEKVAELSMGFLHNGVPRLERTAVWNGFTEKHHAWHRECTDTVGETLHAMLSHPNVMSKEWVIRQYDHEVQGTSVIKPLHGIHDGPGDASVVAPMYGNTRGVVVSNGINHHYGTIDPYWMAAANIDEALRNIVCVGGTIDHAAILDNFCWGDPNDPKELGGIVRASQGCYDAAKHFGVPFISGKDSLNNTYRDKHGKKHSIPGTLLISAISVIQDVRKSVTMDFKQAGNFVYIVGETKSEMGGSLYALLHNLHDTRIPRVDFAYAKKTMHALSETIAQGFVRACHDCSEGGLAVAALEMAIASGKGVALFLDKVPVSRHEKNISDIEKMFSESCTRFIVEVAPRHRKQFEHAMKGIVCANIGEILDGDACMIYDSNSERIFEAPVATLATIWKNQ